VFRLAVVKSALQSALQVIREQGITVFATSSHKGMPAEEVDLKRPVAFLIGNEGAGVGKQAISQADELVAIPHSAKVESLNAAIAASVLLYEVSRQRRS
jgi:TrmH family RNA methyltransferase